MGTVPYNNPNPRQQQQVGSLGAVPTQPRVLKPFDAFLAAATTFLNTLPAISLEEIKFKGSQQMLHFTKLPENLNLPKDPQKVIEYKSWRIAAETFLNSYGSTLAIFKSRKWSWEIKMTPTIFAAYLQRIGTPNGARLTASQMHERHNHCVFENLDLSSRNFNIWQSVVFYIHFWSKRQS